MTEINGSYMQSKIKSIAKEVENSDVSGRRVKANTLEGITKEGQKLLDDMGRLDKDVTEVANNLDVSIEEFENFSDEYEVQIDAYEEQQEELEEAQYRLSELEEKSDSEEGLTEEEWKEYTELSDEIDNISDNIKTTEKDINKTGDSLDDIGGNIAGFQATLNEIHDKSKGYKEAGEKIKDSVNEYGKDADKCEKLIKRNSRSWFNIGNWGSDDNTRLAKDTAERGLNNIGNNSFYDAKNNKFTTTFQEMKEAGGNQVRGWIRRCSVETYSMGAAVEKAADFIEKKAKDAE